MTLSEEPGVFPDLSAEHAYLVTYAQILCAVALCDDDLHVQSLPLWESVFEEIDGPGDGSEFDDTLRVLAGTGYGRFCVETGPPDRGGAVAAPCRGQGAGAGLATGDRPNTAGTGDRGLGGR